MPPVKSDEVVMEEISGPGGAAQPSADAQNPGADQSQTDDSESGEGGNQDVSATSEGTEETGEGEEEVSTEGGAGGEEESESEEGVEASAGKNGIEKRIGKLTQQRREAERLAREAQRQRDAALDELDRLRAAAGQGTEKPSKETAAEEDPMPGEPDLSDPATFATNMAKYTKDLAAWSARQAVKADRAAREQQDVTSRQTEFVQRTEAQYQQRREKAIETLPDYVDIAESDDLAISQTMAGAIKMDEHGPAMAYYLGQHPDEAERISKLSLGQQLIEMGVIKARVTAPRPKKKIPDPIKPLTGGEGNPPPKGLDDLDMDAYAARRNQEIASARGGR